MQRLPLLCRGRALSCTALAGSPSAVACPHPALQTPACPGVVCSLSWHPRDDREQAVKGPPCPSEAVGGRMQGAEWGQCVPGGGWGPGWGCHFLPLHRAGRIKPESRCDWGSGGPWWGGGTAGPMQTSALSLLELGCTALFPSLAVLSLLQASGLSWAGQLTGREGPPWSQAGGNPSRVLCCAPGPGIVAASTVDVMSCVCG